MSARLLEINDYPTTLRTFDWKALWELVDGTPERLNLAHECIDRHPRQAVALRIQHADGRREIHTFAALAAWSVRFAHWLEAEGVARGEAVAIMLGPEGLALRIRDCSPKVLLVDGDAGRWQAEFPDVRVVAVDAAFESALAGQPAAYAPATAADDLAVFQYTSGTTRTL